MSACYAACGVPSGTILYNYFYGHFNIVSVCLSALWLVAPHLGLFSVPMFNKKDARFTGVIVHAMAILYVSGISQHDYRAAVRNEKELNFIAPTAVEVHMRNWR